MAPDKRKIQNIITIAIGALAVVLVTVVILVKTGVISSTREKETETTDATVLVSEVVEYSEVNEDGEIEYYTMINYYMKPSISSNHSYPYVPKTTTTEPVTTTEKQYYIEYTDVEEETDENGEKVTDENGKAVTKTVVHTKKTDEEGNVIENGTTAEPTTTTTSQLTTKIVYVTDPISKKPIKNLRGEYVTAEVLTEAPTTTTTTTKPVVHYVGETSSTDAPSSSTKKGEGTTKKGESTTKKPVESTSDLSVTEPSSENNPAPVTSAPQATYHSGRLEQAPSVQ